MKRKDPAAAALAAKRWSKLSTEERSEQNQQAAATRYKGTTAAERSTLMRELVAKRWAKRSKPKRASR